MLVLTLLENVISLDYRRAAVCSSRSLSFPPYTSISVGLLCFFSAVYGRWLLGVFFLFFPFLFFFFLAFTAGSHGETFYDDYCNSLPQTIITFHYENGGHIITWISHTDTHGHQHTGVKPASRAPSSLLPESPKIPKMQRLTDIEPEPDPDSLWQMRPLAVFYLLQRCLKFSVIKYDNSIKAHKRRRVSTFRGGTRLKILGRKPRNLQRLQRRSKFTIILFSKSI